MQCKNRPCCALSEPSNFEELLCGSRKREGPWTRGWVFGLRTSSRRRSGRRSSQPKHRKLLKGHQRRALGDHLRGSQGLEARCVVAKERGENFVRVLTRRRDRTYATRRRRHLYCQARNVDLACECVRLLG